MAEKRTETLVGVFVLMGLLSLGGLIVMFGKFGDSFKSEYRVMVEYEDASGLIKGSEVRMGGAKIGNVASVPKLTESARVVVELKIDEEVRLPKGSKFQIESISLLGDKMVVVVPVENPDGVFYVDGDFVMGSGAGGLDALQSNAQDLAKTALDFAKEAKVSMGKLNAALDEVTLVAGKLNVI